MMIQYYYDEQRNDIFMIHDEGDGYKIFSNIDERDMIKNEEAEKENIKIESKEKLQPPPAKKLKKRGYTKLFAKKVQKALNELIKEKKFDNIKELLKIDGIMGRKTRAAIREFQKSRKLKITGRINRLTRKTLFRKVTSSNIYFYNY